MRPVAFVPQPVHTDALDLLSVEADVVLGFGPEAQLFDRGTQGATAILIRTSELTEHDMQGAPSLRVVARHGVGVDNIDVAAATRLGIGVCNVPNANTAAVTEHAFALLLAVRRNVVTADRRLRSGDFGSRDALAGGELRAQRLGVIGLGRIGAEVARVAREGFHMRVVGFDPYLTDDGIHARGLDPAGSLEALLANSGMISVHVPLTEETYGLLGASALDLLPPGAVVIDTSRGGVVDEQALYERLLAGKIAGAGLDVFASEPPPADHPLFDLDNVVVTPHLAGQSTISMRSMAVGAAEAIVATLRGQRPPHLVNPEAWASKSR